MANQRMAGDIHWVNGLNKCKGKADLLRFYRGERLTQRQAIAAHCCICSSGYDTGLGCRVKDCPLVLYNPYTLAKYRSISHELDAV